MGRRDHDPPLGHRSRHSLITTDRRLSQQRPRQRPGEPNIALARRTPDHPRNDPRAHRIRLPERRLPSAEHPRLHRRHRTSPQQLHHLRRPGNQRMRRDHPIARTERADTRKAQRNLFTHQVPPLLPNHLIQLLRHVAQDPHRRAHADRPTPVSLDRRPQCQLRLTPNQRIANKAARSMVVSLPDDCVPGSIRSILPETEPDLHAYSNQKGQ